MAQDKSAKSEQTTDSDYEAVLAQLASLRTDLEKLAETMSDIAHNRGEAFADDVSEGIDEAAKYLGQQARAGEARFGGAVAAHPYVALAMAAGAGLLLGALSRR